ncbi:MAG: SDR family oxidoreductase [Pseudomonadota bacterium]
MKTVVITGSTRGIGHGLAVEFLKRGSSVMLSGRSKTMVDREVQKLGETWGKNTVGGSPCDIIDYTNLQALWDAAVNRFGTVDIWINNAGITHETLPVLELEPKDIKAVLDTNITGLIYGTHVAMRGMVQQGHGFIYNMEGHGSHDEMHAGLTIYGTTKRAVRYFCESLALEMQDSPVKTGLLGPGIVVTDLIIDELRKMSPERLEMTKAIYNCLADTVETVTPWLVENILSNEENGREIMWLNEEKAQERFNSEEYCARDLFSAYGF